MKRKRATAGRLRQGSRLTWLVFYGPAVLLYTGFVILPAMLGFVYGLTDWSGWSSGGDPDDLVRAAGAAVRLEGEQCAGAAEDYLGAEFVGLDNFHELAGDTTFMNTEGLEAFSHSAVGFTLFQTVMIALTFTFVAMVLAVLLDSLRRMKGLIRGLFFYPYVLSLLVSGLLFTYMANYREGAINVVLDAIGLATWKQDWMMGSAWAPWFIYALVTWSGLGFFVTLYLANLQTIPTELYEAARIDGAGPVAIFGRIQYPLLRPTMVTNAVLATIVGVNLFPQIVVTTGGGPGTRTVTIGYYIYDLGRLSNRQGYASAVSFVAFVAILVIAIIQVALLRRKQVQL